MEKKWEVILPSYSLLQTLAGVMCLLLCTVLQKRKIESNWKFQQKVVVLIRSLENEVGSASRERRCRERSRNVIAVFRHIKLAAKTEVVNCSLCPLGIQKELMDLNCSQGDLRKTLGQAFHL